MSTSYQALVSEIKRRLVKEFTLETATDTDDLRALPYPYIISGKGKRNALFYWDTFFINQALIKFKMVDQARHNVENLIHLYRSLGYIPQSSYKQHKANFYPPLLPWMIRDIYRATGDKEWMRRVLPDAVKEFQFWTTKPHTSSTGLFRYTNKHQANPSPKKQGLFCALRFPNPDQVNPVDLNAILYRNAKLLYDLQIEDAGQGDEQIIAKSDHIKKLFDMLWEKDDQFYYDNDLDAKSLIKVKSLSGYMPLFVELLSAERANILVQQLKQFRHPGGPAFSLPGQDARAPESGLPIISAPCLYFIIKGMVDYEYMEEALDIATPWLDMVTEIYEKTGELWEWYNVRDRSHQSDNGYDNNPVMGWTAGTFIALMDTLGLEL